MRRAIRWIADYWYVPLFAVGAVFCYLLGLSSRKPKGQIVYEVDTIKDIAKVRKLQAEKGAEAAHAYVDLQYDMARNELDDEAKEKVRAYWYDPALRLRALRNVTSGERH